MRQDDTRETVTQPSAARPREPSQTDIKSLTAEHGYDVVVRQEPQD
jgi:hypothetical protein